MGSNLKLNDQIEEYINSHSIKLHPVQYEIIKYNETLGEIKKMQISISQCHFLHFIVKIIKPKNILEIGTFTGLSALTMGLAMDENCKLTALDKNKETSDVAISFFKKAKIDNKINLLINNAIVSLDDLNNQKKKFDFIFIDADKENYMTYYEMVMPKLNPKSFSQSLVYSEKEFEFPSFKAINKVHIDISNQKFSNAISLQTNKFSLRSDLYNIKLHLLQFVQRSEGKSFFVTRELSLGFTKSVSQFI